MKVTTETSSLFFPGFSSQKGLKEKTPVHLQSLPQPKSKQNSVKIIVNGQDNDILERSI